MLCDWLVCFKSNPPKRLFFTKTNVLSMICYTYVRVRFCNSLKKSRTNKAIVNLCSSMWLPRNSCCKIILYRHWGNTCDELKTIFDNLNGYHGFRRTTIIRASSCSKRLMWSWPYTCMMKTVLTKNGLSLKKQVWVPCNQTDVILLYPRSFILVFVVLGCIWLQEKGFGVFC